MPAALGIALIALPPQWPAMAHPQSQFDWPLPWAACPCGAMWCMAGLCSEFCPESACMQVISAIAAGATSGCISNTAISSRRDMPQP